MASDHPFSLAAWLSREVFVVTAPISSVTDLGQSRNCLMLTCQLFQDGTPSNSLRLWFLCFDCGVLVSRAGLHLGFMIWGEATPHGC